MPRTYDAVDYIEPVHDTMMEQFGNSTNYHVINGCEPTYSATSLVVTVAAGSVTHNAVRLTVAEDTVTLVPDATHPLWAWVAIDSSAEAVVVHGTAAADPEVPELGDYVQVALVKVEPNQTAANACAVKLDKRMIGPRLVRVVIGEGATTTTLSSDQVVTQSWTTVTGLSVNVAANTRYQFTLTVLYTAATADDLSYRLVGPTGSVFSTNSLFTDDGAADFEHDTDTTQTSTNFVDGLGLATPGVIHFQGTILTGSTAGTLSFQGASASANPTGAVTIKAKSRMELL